MPTYIHLVRHAQGVHNTSTELQQLRDPDLTQLGETQCAQLRDNFPWHDKITHLVSSPLRRTLRTTLLAFAPEVDAGKRIIALPEIQELSTLPCDVGSDLDVLTRDFDTAKVDFSLIKQGWCDKSPASPWEPSIEKIKARAQRARVWLRDLAKDSEGDVHIVVVCHGGFIHFFTEDWEGMDARRGTGWGNTDFRTYEFADPTGQDPNATLQETSASWRERRGSAQPLTETEQREIQSVEEKEVEKGLRWVLEQQQEKGMSAP